MTWKPPSTAPVDGTPFLGKLSNGWCLTMSGRFNDKSRYMWWRAEGLSIPYVRSHGKLEWTSSTMFLVGWQDLPEEESPYSKDD